jgi:hypothetical protein
VPPDNASQALDVMVTSFGPLDHFCGTKQYIAREEAVRRFLFFAYLKVRRYATFLAEQEK